MNRDDFSALEGRYALGWSVVHFLLTDPRYRGAIPAWLTTLRETGDPGKARDKALENTTFEALERDWKKWVTEE